MAMIPKKTLDEEIKTIGGGKILVKHEDQPKAEATPLTVRMAMVQAILAPADSKDKEVLQDRYFMASKLHLPDVEEVPVSKSEIKMIRDLVYGHWQKQTWVCGYVLNILDKA